MKHCVNSRLVVSENQLSSCQWVIAPLIYSYCSKALPYQLSESFPNWWNSTFVNLDGVSEQFCTGSKDNTKQKWPWDTHTHMNIAIFYGCSFRSCRSCIFPYKWFWLIPISQPYGNYYGLVRSKVQYILLYMCCWYIPSHAMCYIILYSYIIGISSVKLHKNWYNIPIHIMLTGNYSYSCNTTIQLVSTMKETNPTETTVCACHWKSSRRTCRWFRGVGFWSKPHTQIRQQVWGYMDIWIIECGSNTKHTDFICNDIDIGDS